MNILYVSQYFPPEIGAPAARVSELSRYWVEQGHEVTVLTGFPNHPTGKIPPEYRSKFRRMIMRERISGVNVVRTWLLPFANRRPYERMLNYSSYCASAVLTGTFLNRPDVIVATSPQLLAGLAGWWISRCKRAPFVFEVRDLWPESLLAVGAASESSLLYRTLARVAGFLYRAADHIVVVTPAFKTHLVKHWRVPPEKISNVPNGVESDIFRPQDAGLLRKQLGLEGKFVVSYIGTMGNAHGLGTLVQAAGILQSVAPEIAFLLVGEGAERESILAQAQAQGLANLRFLGEQPRAKIPEFIAVSDACLVLLKQASLFTTVIPTKMLEFMSCERPVILGAAGEAAKILHEARAGIAIEPENAVQLAGTIMRLAGDRTLCRNLGQNGREFILRNLARQQTATDYIRILEGLRAKAGVPAEELVAA